ncbi:MAG: pentapeptide repeat-containing protein [Arenicellales bacterium]
MTRIHFLLTCLYVSSLTLLSSGQAAAHQWDTPVPHLSERMQLVKTGNCPNCTLSDADLSYKELAGTTLTGADLRQANFMRTGLKDAILIGADLRSANFTWADLHGTDFTDANLYGASLSGSRNLSQAIFCRTVMPDGTVSNLHC